MTNCLTSSAAPLWLRDSRLVSVTQAGPIVAGEGTLSAAGSLAAAVERYVPETGTPFAAASGAVAALPHAVATKMPTVGIRRATAPRAVAPSLVST